MLKRTLWGAALALVLAPSFAAAADSGFREGVRAATKTGRLFSASLPVLVKRAGPGREEMLKRALTKVAPSSGQRSRSTEQLTSTGEASEVRGQGWFLQVQGEGEIVRFRDTKALEDPESTATTLEQRMPQKKAEQLALSYAKQQLADLIELGSGERLEPWYVSYAISTGGSAISGPVESEKRVVAVKVVLTRVIDGITVVGDGSKITVIMTNDGAPAGFDVNWSRLERTNRVQRTVARGKVEERAARVTQRRASPGQVQSRQKLECGLYDSGHGSSGADIQAACMSTYELTATKAGMHTTSAWVDAVPMGDKVTAEPTWPESVMFGTR
ncbi:hypothetical protein WME91_09385 [Sorangium sp. So ce269]